MPLPILLKLFGGPLLRLIVPIVQLALLAFTAVVAAYAFGFDPLGFLLGLAEQWVRDAISPV